MSQHNPRYPEIALDDLDEDQKRVFDAIVAGPRGRVAGPLQVWLQSPNLAARAQALGQFARYDSSLPPVLSELAILVTGRIWGSEFEWATHAPIAHAAGLPADVIKAISLGLRPNFQDHQQTLVFNFAVELHRDRAVSDASFAKATEALGTRGVVDLVGICGYYTLISMTINVFDVPYDTPAQLPALDLALSEYFRETDKSGP